MCSRVLLNNTEANTVQPFATPGEVLQARYQHKKYLPLIFRAGLYQSIAEEDPGYNCFKTGAGRGINLAFDMALFAPLAEMAGFNNIRHSNNLLFNITKKEIGEKDWIKASELRNNLNAIAAKRPFVTLVNYTDAVKNKLRYNKESLIHEMLTQ